MPRRTPSSPKSSAQHETQRARAAWPPPRLAHAIVATVILAVAAVLVWRINDPIGVRPDSWSEAEVIISGWGYAASGFFAYAGLPQHQISPPVDPYFLYANYPVLSNVLYGVMHRLGADAYGLYRLPAILGSLAAVWLWYLLITRLVDRATGVAAAIALATSFGFLSYADNIHQQAYPLAPQFGAFLCLVIAFAPETRERRKWLVGCALCLLLVGLITVELHAWLVIALGGYVVLFRPAGRWRWLPLLILPLFAGVALQWLQSWAGSPIPEDRPSFVENLYRRSIGFAEALDTPRDNHGKKISLAMYPAFIVERFREFYLLPVWVVPLLMLFGFVGAGAPRAPPTQWPSQIKLLLILLLAALGWMGTMMQQTAVHEAAMRQLLPFYALLLGVVWTQSVRAVLDPQRSKVLGAVLVVIALATLVPHAQATWSNLRMHLDLKFFHPLLKEGGGVESVDLAPLRSLPEGTVILTNHNRLPHLRYWSHRPTYLASNSIPEGAGVQRSLLDLTFNYLRGLYQEQLPPMVYLYNIYAPTPRNIRRRLADDPLLRALTIGSFEPLASEEQIERAVQAFRGEVPAFCPITVRGGSWRSFDLTPLMPVLRSSFRNVSIPKLKEMPAPR